MANAEILNSNQMSALSAALSAAAEAAAGTLTGLLTKQTSLRVGEITGMGLGEVAAQFGGGVVNIKMAFSGAVSGGGAFLLHEKDAALMADLMIGQDGSNPPESLSDLHLSAVSEVGGQMSSAFGSALASAVNKKFNINSSDLELTPASGVEGLAGQLGGEVVVAQLPLQMEGQAPSEMYFLLSLAAAKALSTQGSAAPAAAPAPAPAAKASSGFTPASTFSGSAQGGPTMVQPAQMPMMAPEAGFSGAPGNLDLLLDVSLQVTVELGRTQKTVREILSFGSGSVVELDKLAGEPVDILVNEKPIAKGEVVVIDENFGIRITEILSPRERISL